MKIINLEKHWEDVERKKKKNNLLLSLCTLAKNVPSARINLGTTVIFMLSDFFPVFSFGILFPFKFIPLSIETPTTPKNLLIFLFIEVIKNLFFFLFLPFYLLHVILVIIIAFFILSFFYYFFIFIQQSLFPSVIFNLTSVFPSTSSS